MAEDAGPIFLLAGGRGTRMRKGPDPVLQAVFHRAGVRNPGWPTWGLPREIILSFGSG